MATTSKLGDFLGRALNNINPGSSNASDFLGRATTSGNKDYLGVGLTDTPSYPPAEWQTATAYTVGQTRRIPGTKEVQTLTATGTPAGSLKLDVTLRGVTRKTNNISVATINSTNIQTAISSLDNVEPGECTVSGTGPYTLTWESELGNVGQVVEDNTDVTGGSYAVTTTTQGAVNEQILQVVTAGTSHASNKPVAPAVGATVTDGTVTWKRIK